MNKFGLFLCVLLTINYAQSSVVDGLDINDIYDKFVVISKGMADSTAYKCSANLLKNKQKIISTIEIYLMMSKEENQWSMHLLEELLV